MNKEKLLVVIIFLLMHCPTMYGVENNFQDDGQITNQHSLNLPSDTNFYSNDGESETIPIVQQNPVFANLLNKDGKFNDSTTFKMVLKMIDFGYNKAKLKDTDQQEKRFSLESNANLLSKNLEKHGYVLTKTIEGLSGLKKGPQGMNLGKNKQDVAYIFTKNKQQAFVIFVGSHNEYDWEVNNYQILENNAELGLQHPVVKGFALKAAHVQNLIVKALKEIQPKEVYFSGHSQGAALAALSTDAFITPQENSRSDAKDILGKNWQQNNQVKFIGVSMPEALSPQEAANFSKNLQGNAMIYNVAGTDSDLQSDAVAISGKTKSKIVKAFNPFLTNTMINDIALYGIDSQKNKNKGQAYEEVLRQAQEDPKALRTELVGQPIYAPYNETRTQRSKLINNSFPYLMLIQKNLSDLRKILGIHQNEDFTSDQHDTSFSEKDENIINKAWNNLKNLIDYSKGEISTGFSAIPDLTLAHLGYRLPGKKALKAIHKDIMSLVSNTTLSQEERLGKTVALSNIIIGWRNNFNKTDGSFHYKLVNPAISLENYEKNSPDYSSTMPYIQSTGKKILFLERRVEGNNDLATGDLKPIRTIQLERENRDKFSLFLDTSKDLYRADIELKNPDNQEIILTNPKTNQSQSYHLTEKDSYAKLKEILNKQDPKYIKEKEILTLLENNQINILTAMFSQEPH
jgi:hypothetical protein